MEFVASLLRAVLSWPVALAFTVYLLRTQLRRLVDRIETARHKDTELSFAREVEQLREKVAEEQPPPADTDVDEASVNELSAVVEEAAARQANRLRRTKAERLAATLADHPSAGVLAAWDFLDEALRQRVTRLGVTKPELFSVPSAAALLQSMQVISDSDRQGILELRRLRDEVAHGGTEPNSAAAIEYGATVDRMLFKLE